MTTEISLHHVDSRNPYRNLKFTDGFPDDAIVAKVYDNLDFQRGVQAFLTAPPAVSVKGIRAGSAGFDPVNQTVLISEQLLDSKSLRTGSQTKKAKLLSISQNAATVPIA